MSPTSEPVPGPTKNPSLTKENPLSEDVKNENQNDEQKPVAKKAATPKPEPKKDEAPEATVGRIVHYYTDPDGQQRPALVTEVDGVSVSLTIFNSLGSHFRDDVPFAPVPTPGYWSWPERN